MPGGSVLFLWLQVGVRFPVAVGGDVLAPPSTTRAVASFQSPTYHVLGYPFGGLFLRRVELGKLIAGNWRARSRWSQTKVACGDGRRLRTVRWSGRLRPRCGNPSLSVCQLLLVPMFGYLSCPEDLLSEPIVLLGQFILVHTLDDVPGHCSEQHFSVNDVSHLCLEA
jgi:hypothetical protein